MRRKIVGVFAALLLAATAQARVTRVVVSADARPWENEGKQFGSVGAYRRVTGLIYGDLDPANPHNVIIQDMKLATRNAAGKVEYVSTFTLYMPADMSKWSGNVLYEIANRGSSIMENRFESGDVFLASGWQGDIPLGEAGPGGVPRQTIQVPIAKNPDGSAVTGQVLARFMNLRPGTKTISLRSAIGYSTSGPAPEPFSLDTTQATLTTRSYESVTGASSAVTAVPSTDWAWGDCSAAPFPGKPDGAHLCLKSDANPALLYQLLYVGKDPLVLGVGLAAIRDVGAFFRFAEADDAGWKNPLRSDAHKNAIYIIRGASQSGNLLRTFLNLGFNVDESNRQVYAGAMSLIAGRQTPLNYRFAIPGGAGGVQELGSDGVDWWSDWLDPVRQQPASGLLHRCAATQSCPKIIELMGSSEFWSLRASPDFVGTTGAADIPLPPNVRRYYIASTQHGGGPGGFRVEEPARPQMPAGTPQIGGGAPCVFPTNPNSEREFNAALLVALEQWVGQDVPPPASRYPTLAAHTLAPADVHSMGFPSIPPLPSPDSMANPLLVYDLGKEFRSNDLSGVVTRRPAAILAVVPPMVPTVDADGNEVGGIHSVLQQAALGTYLGWNVTAAGFTKGQYCSLAGSFIPFAVTKSARLAAGDTRLSLEERYGTQKGYSCVARYAAEGLLKERLLLPEDATRLTNEAANSNVLPPHDTASEEDRRRADLVCTRE